MKNTYMNLLKTMTLNKTLSQFIKKIYEIRRKRMYFKETKGFPKDFLWGSALLLIK